MKDPIFVGWMFKNSSDVASTRSKPSVTEVKSYGMVCGDVNDAVCLCKFAYVKKPT